MKLSRHFSLSEMTKSQTASRLGIFNNPDDEEVNNLSILCRKVLDQVRDNYGIPFSPSSGFRSSELNAQIGGASTSQHVEGRAADIEVPTVDNLLLAVWIRDNLKFDQLILEHYDPVDPSSGWVHVSYAFKKNRMECLSYVDGDYRIGIGGGSIEDSGGPTRTRRSTFAKLTLVLITLIRDALSPRRRND